MKADIIGVKLVNAKQDAKDFSRAEGKKVSTEDVISNTIVHGGGHAGGRRHNEITDPKDAGTFMSPEGHDSYHNRNVGGEKQKGTLKDQFPLDKKPKDNRNENIKSKLRNVKFD